MVLICFENIMLDKFCLGDAKLLIYGLPDRWSYCHLKPVVALLYNQQFQYTYLSSHLQLLSWQSFVHYHCGLIEKLQ